MWRVGLDCFFSNWKRSMVVVWRLNYIGWGQSDICPDFLFVSLNSCLSSLGPAYKMGVMGVLMHWKCSNLFKELN